MWRFDRYTVLPRPLMARSVEEAFGPGSRLHVPETPAAERFAQVVRRILGW